MTKKYDYMFKWIKHSTREEHHSKEIENFAKNNYNLFMAFHTLSRPIIHFDENTPEYMDAKEKIITLFEDNEDIFEPFLDIVKENFIGEYY